MDVLYLLPLVFDGFLSFMSARRLSSGETGFRREREKELHKFADNSSTCCHGAR
jgi:hypothetical protein